MDLAAASLEELDFAKGALREGGVVREQRTYSFSIPDGITRNCSGVESSKLTQVHEPTSESLGLYRPGRLATSKMTVNGC